MLSGRQVESYLENMGLEYKATQGKVDAEGKGTWYRVYDETGNVAIEYNPFSCWIINHRTATKEHSDTVAKFKKLCVELAQE